jgi:hypothetical protein
MISKMQVKDILQMISFVATTVSALTAVTAAIFVSRQIANIRRNREVDTLFKIISLSDDEKTYRAKERMKYDLRPELTFQELKQDKNTLGKFYQLVHFFETIGVVVSAGHVSEKLIFDKYGLFIIGSWGRLQNLIHSFRIDNQSYEYAENFQLLVSRYDRWAAKNKLKVITGERIRLNDARDFLDYRREQPMNHNYEKAQKFLNTTEGVEIARSLATHGLGIFVPHMHEDSSGEALPLPTGVVSHEDNLRVSFKNRQELDGKAVPVGWRWNGTEVEMCSACCGMDGGDGGRQV